VVFTDDKDLVEAEQYGVEHQKVLSIHCPDMVPSVYEEWVGEDGAYFVSMALVEGVKLSKILDQGAMAPARAIKIARQLCEFLEASHEILLQAGGKQRKGILHNDLKPQHVILTDTDKIRIIDFGGARSVAVSRKLTRALFGTPAWSSPEHLKGQSTPQSDLWAVGVMLYQMVAGHLPFRSQSESAAQIEEEIQRKILNGNVEPLPLTCPMSLKQILLKCLAHDPSQRFQNATELKTQLNLAAEGKDLTLVAPEDPYATRRTSSPAFLESLQTQRTDAALPPVPPKPRADRDETRAPRVVIPQQTKGEATQPKPVSTPAKARRVAAVTATPEAKDAPKQNRIFAWRPWHHASVRAFLAVAGLLFIAGGALSHVYAKSRVTSLQRTLATSSSDTTLVRVLRGYRDVRPFSWIDTYTGAGDFEQNLYSRLVLASDRVLESFYTDNPRTVRGDWVRSREWLEGALEIEPTNQTLQAKLYTAQGHLDRIDSRSARNKKKPKEANRLLEQAEYQFKTAHELDPDLPDPFLGLSRIYAYESRDVKKLEQALEDLEMRGYQRGKREKAQLADAYLAEAHSLHASAKRTKGIDAQRLFDKAWRTAIQAQGHYQPILDFAQAKKNQRDARNLQKEIEEAMARLH
ncbi:MAG: protein kinase, partial [Candidatus Eisenbacteria bacterium]|nr:protein kinase [Candidatus Eisenbacteria bacterium]